MNAPERSWLVAVVMAGLLTGCTRTRRAPDPEANASASASSPTPSEPPSASTTPSAAPPVAGPPTGGVKSWEPVDGIKGCSSHNRELDTNLAFGSISVASRGKDLAVTRFFRSESKGEGQIAFGGYDNQTRTVATSHGLGKAKLLPTWVFPRKDDWVVFWFDARGLVFTKTGWAATVSKIARFAAIPIEESDRVTILNASPDDTLLGIAPLSVEPNSQLGLFSFVPGEHLAEDVKAIGATHQAVRPKNPTVAATTERYFLAWEDTLSAGGSTAIVATRFDKNGREQGPQVVVSTSGAAAKQPAITLHENGVVLAWTQTGASGDEVIVQSFDKDLNPLAGAQRIDRGVRPALASVKGGAVLAFLRHGTDPKLAHAAAAFVDGKGSPSTRGVLLSAPDHAKDFVVETPSVIGSEEDWVAAFFTFSSGQRSQVRTFKLDCLSGP